LATTPVIIIEGARAMGKTTLARLWLKDNGGTFVDLTLEDTLRAARTEGEAFVDGLSVPSVIDEAQLAREFTLNLKRRVDRGGGNGQFLLTGSSRISSDSLGGSDPLAGRAQRLRLFGLTQGEIKRQPVSIIQWLHDGNFANRSLPGSGDLLGRMYTGGLPSIGVSLGISRLPATRHREAIGDYVTQVLRDPNLGSQLDRTRIVDLLRVVAAAPGMILNADKLSKDLRTSRETLSRHLAILEQYFLINRVPALGSDARRELMGHPRIVPADTSFTAWATGLGPTALAGRTDVTGGMVHTFVANELMAQAGWGDLGVRFYHWRNGTNEADLVLRYDDGTTVAIEVKSSKTVNAQAAKGLAAFLKTHDLSRSHGVVFYDGTEIKPLGDRIWAVPISALWHEEFDEDLQPTKARPNRAEPIAVMPSSEAEQPTDAALFLSYVRADDDAEHGRITQLARDLIERYRLITGEELELFIDKDSIRWGDEWQARIKSQLMQTTFFVPVVTPRFLKSAACRDEVGTFERTSRTLGTEAFILPILWNELRGNDSEDSVAVLLKSRNWENWTQLKYEDRTSGAYNRQLDEMANRLANAVDTIAQAKRPAPVSAEELAADSSDILDLMERAEEAVLNLPQAMESWQPAVLGAFSAAGQALNQLPNDSPGSPSALRATLARAARAMTGPGIELEAESQRFRLTLKDLDDSLSSIIAFASRTPDAADSLGLIRALKLLSDDIPSSFDLEPGQLETFVTQISALGKVSREMREPTRALSDAVLLISDVLAMFESWRRQIDAL
jgi:predicted AAA+ superfamily ATPase